MFRLLFSAFGTFLLAAAFASALVDAYESFKAKQLMTTGLSTLLQNLIPGQYEAFLSFLSARFPQNFAQLWLKIFNTIPISLVLSASAALVLALNAKSKRKIGFSSR